MMRRNVLIAMGNSSCGKSELLKIARAKFGGEGLDFKMITDRQLLAMKVKEDIENGYVIKDVEDRKAHVSKYAICFNHGVEDLNRSEFWVRDGTLLNEAHKLMANMAVNGIEEGNSLNLLLEWTIAPTVKKFAVLPQGSVPLLQSAEDGVRLLWEVKNDVVPGEIVIVGIDADFRYRKERNKRRGAHMIDADFFNFAFNDGKEGEGKLNESQIKRLGRIGITAMDYNNNYDDQRGYIKEMTETICPWVIQQFKEGGRGHPERER